MPTSKASTQVHLYFAPFYGLGVGALIAWYAAYTSGTLAADHIAWVGRFFAVTTSLIMWTLFTTTLQGKEIYGGGMIEKNDTSRRTSFVCLVIFGLWALSLIAYVSHHTLIFWGCSLLQMVILFGEVGWRDPKFIYTACLGQK